MGFVPPCHCAFCVVLLGMVCMGTAVVGGSCAAFVCVFIVAQHLFSFACAEGAFRFPRGFPGDLLEHLYVVVSFAAHEHLHGVGHVCYVLWCDFRS